MAPTPTASTMAAPDPRLNQRPGPSVTPTVPQPDVSRICLTAMPVTSNFAAL